jgi:hypothetical protein
LLREDIDFGWRANAAGSVVLSVPLARLRHARALTTGQRKADVIESPVAAVNRAHGLRAFLVNCSLMSYWLGLVRLPLLSFLRALAFLVLRRSSEAAAEFGAIGYLLGGRAGLPAARAERRRVGRRRSVRGRLTSRFTRSRASGRHRSRAAPGRQRNHARHAAGRQRTGRRGFRRGPCAPKPRGQPGGPDSLPAGALRGAGSRGSGLRRPSGVLAVPLPEKAQTNGQAAVVPAGLRPSPTRRGDETPAGRDLVFVEMNRRRVLSATLFAPPVVLPC